MKKSKLLAGLAVTGAILCSPLLFSGCGKDNSYKVNYNYGFQVGQNTNFAFEDIFDNYTTSQKVEKGKWITSIPKLKDSVCAEFEGWYIEGSDKQIKDYDYISEDITLVAKWKQQPSGLYSNSNIYEKTWKELYDTQHPSLTIYSEGDGPLYLQAVTKSLEGKIIVDDDVKGISTDAFLDCVGVTEITLPESITEIGYSAFKNCTSLTNVKLPKTITSILGQTFSGCSSLNQITIPETVVVIGPKAFNGCTSLNNVTIPNSVEIIQDNAFENCKNFTSVYIPKSVTNIGLRVFAGCENVESIIVDKENLNYNSYNTIADMKSNNNAIVETSTNKLVSGCYKTIIGEHIVEIADGAFKGCSKLDYLYIPTSVTKIGEGITEGCNHYGFLLSVSKSHDVYKIENGGLVEKATQKLIAATRNTNLQETTITEIGNYAFAGMECLETLVIPNSVTKIGSYAFKDCINLKSIILPEGIDTLEEGLFKNCRSLKEIKMPNSLVQIRWDAFGGCESLTIMELPESLQVVPYLVFGNPNLKLVINNGAIVSKIFYVGSENSLNCDIDKVYIKHGEDFSDATWFNNNYTKQESTDKAGYDYYIRNF